VDPRDSLYLNHTSKKEGTRLKPPPPASALGDSSSTTSTGGAGASSDSPKISGPQASPKFGAQDSPKVSSGMSMGTGAAAAAAAAAAAERGLGMAREDKELFSRPPRFLFDVCERVCVFFCVHTYTHIYMYVYDGHTYVCMHKYT